MDDQKNDDVQVELTPTTGKSSLEAFRAMRGFLERKMEAQGLKLHPNWYKDGPEDLPQLYKS